MDAFELLKADHRKVAQLFVQLESADGRAKLPVFEQIRTELELHTHIEETIFYPALEKPKPTHDITLEAYEEHGVVKKLLQQMSRTKSVNDEWEAQAKVLRENVEHHVEEEEGELFSKAEDVLTQDDIEELGDRMQAEKQRKQGTKSAGAKKARGRTAASSKKASGSKARSSKKASKKSGSKKSTRGRASASKSSSRSTAAKTARKSRSKKSSKKTAKKR